MIQKRKQSDKIDYIGGRNVAFETLSSKRPVYEIFVQENTQHKRLNEIIQLAKQKNIPITTKNKRFLDQLLAQSNHQGVVMAVEPFKYAELEDLFALADRKHEMPFFIMLDGIEDPHNLGSIMRTADAIGAHGIIIPKHRAVALTATVAKTSTGAIEHMPVVQVTNLVQTMKKLKEKGVWIFGTDMNGTDYRDWEADLPLTIVIGNEGKGLSTLVKREVDGMVTLPMVGHVQSLNASVAASILMYEVFRKRSAKQGQI